MFYFSTVLNCVQLAPTSGMSSLLIVP